MRTYLIDDFSYIKKRMRRNIVEDMCQRARLTTGPIPDEVLLNAGFSADEITKLGSQRNLPLNQTDLLT